MTKDPLPENAYAASPLAGRSQKPQSTSTKQRKSSPSSSRLSNFPCAADAMRRPIQLLPQPHALNACKNDVRFSESLSPKMAPSLSTPAALMPCRSLPSAFRYAGQVHEIVRNWGPERIETGWWNGYWYRRDYFRIETSRGQWWWIFKDLNQAENADAGWYLHGLFA